MNTAESEALLADYVRTGSEAAFRELVMRYIDLVYSTALRSVGGDGHFAEDVTQIVFADLARKARRLAADSMLGGWLHRHTCYVASTMIRTERRRQEREQRAVEMNASDHTEENLGWIAPMLDDAINQLGAEDRAAILLRFFEQRDLRSVGHAMGTTEDAARMRITRALEKLETLLKTRGVALSGGALGTVLATEAVSAAPAGLTASVVGTSLAGTTTTSGLAALSSLKIAVPTGMKISILSALAVAALVGITLQQRSQVNLRQQNQLLSRQVAGLTVLKEENERLSNMLASASAAALSSRQDLSELLRLRGEVGRLRESNKDLLKAANQASAPGQSSQREQFYYVSGAGILAPNRFPFQEGLTVSSAIRAAQGLTPSADKNKIELRRGEGERVTLDFAGIERGTSPDPQLMAGDRLFVPGSPSKPTTIDLGPVELVPNTPKRMAFREGRDCILTGSQLSDGSLDVKMSVEASDHSEQFGQYHITTLSGRTVGVGISDVIVLFTPILAAEPRQADSDNSVPAAFYVRSFQVDAANLLQEIKNSSPGQESESTQQGLVRFLKERGVETVTPATAFLNENNGTLLVRNTLTNLDKLESILVRVQEKR